MPIDAHVQMRAMRHTMIARAKQSQQYENHVKEKTLSDNSSAKVAAKATTFSILKRAS